MPIFADRDRARFVLTGPDIAPPDLARHAPIDRRAYWREVAVLARDEKYRELNLGVDVQGRRMLPRMRPRRDRATGPVLIPHYSDSRFRTRLRWNATDSAAVLWWLAPWDRVVAGHASGIRTRRGRVVRDVVGLTAASLHRVITRAHRWWSARVDRGRMAERAVAIRPTLPITGLPPEILPPAPVPGRRPRPTRLAVVPTRPLYRPGLPLPSFDRPLPVWELARDWSALMGRSARGMTSVTEIHRLAARVGRMQSLAEIRDVLFRLGVDRPPIDRRSAVELLARRALAHLRSGRMPPALRPAPPVPPGPIGSRVVAVYLVAPDLVVVSLRDAEGRLVNRELRPGMMLLGLDFGSWAVRAELTGGQPAAG